MRLGRVPISTSHLEQSADPMLVRFFEQVNVIDTRVIEEFGVTEYLVEWDEFEDIGDGGEIPEYTFGMDYSGNYLSAKLFPMYEGLISPCES